MQVTFDLHKLQPEPKPIELNLVVKSETANDLKDVLFQKESAKFFRNHWLPNNQKGNKQCG